jgi:hypothetical protein
LNKSPDSKNELSAFIDADLKRHTVIHSLSIEPQKKKYYLEALQVLKSKVEINPSSTEISYLIAKEYANMSSLYNPKFGTLYADSAKKAVEICLAAVFEYPKSYGGKNCNSLIKSIKEKSIQIQMEKTNLPNVSFPVLLTYKNISSSHFLIYTFTKDEQQAIQKQFEDVRAKSGYIPYETIVFDYYSKRKPLSNFSINLETPQDFNPHAFINRDDFTSNQDMIDWVMHVNSNEKLQQRYWQEPIWCNPQDWPQQVFTWIYDTLNVKKPHLGIR